MVSVIFPLHFSLMGLHITLTLYYENLICIIIHHCKAQYMPDSIFNTHGWWVYGPHINECHYIYISDLEVTTCIENHCTFDSNLAKLPPF